MNAAIEWLKSVSTVSTLSDGTVTYTFQGTIPAKMRAQVIDAARIARVTPKGIAYSNFTTLMSWGAYFKRNRINFNFNDYTIPVNAATE